MLLYCGLMALAGAVHLEHHHAFRKSVGAGGFLLSYLAHAASALGGLAIVSVRCWWTRAYVDIEQGTYVAGRSMGRG